jgi:hypothetical protein
MLKLTLTQPNPSSHAHIGHPRQIRASAWRLMIYSSMKGWICDRDERRGLCVAS